MAIRKNARPQTCHTSGIAAAVEKIATPLADQLGYRIWDIEFVREGAEYYLRITLDCDAGITIEDCERFSRAIDPLLDEADPIAEAYHLEVSSPGIERELKNAAHIAACVGSPVQAKLFAPLEGSRVWQGELLGMDEQDRVLLRVADHTVAIPRSAISRLTTVYDFS